MKTVTVSAIAAFLVASTAAHAALITVAGDPISGGQLSGSTFNLATEGTNGDTNNFPNGERPSLAIDGDINSKYLNFAQEFTGYVVLPAFGSSIVKGIEFVTANDSTVRDPASYTLYGSNSLTVLPTSSFDLVANGFFQISTGVLALPNTGTNITGDTSKSEGRGFSSSVGFANSTAYTSYILVFPTIRDTGAANSMQIAEAVLSTIPEPTSALMLGIGALGLAGFRRRKVA